MTKNGNINNPRLLLIGSDDNTMHCLKDLPCTIFYLSEHRLNNNYPNIAFEQTIDLQKVDELMDSVHRLHKKYDLDGVIGFKEETLEISALVAHRLGINGLSTPHAVRVSRDKIQFRKLLNEHDFNAVAYATVNNVQAIENFITTHKFDVILKPALGAGSYNTSRLNYGEKITRLPANEYWWMSRSEEEYLIEEFIPGTEYSVETLSYDSRHHIVAIVERRTISDNYFVGKGHIVPANINPELHEKIKHTIEKLLDTIQYKFGPSHTEVKVFQGDVYVIETQTRAGGANIWQMVERVTGINVKREIICRLLGIEAPHQNPKVNCTGVCYFHSKKGILDKIIDKENLLESEAIWKKAIKFMPGDPMPDIQCSDDRRGFAIVHGENYVKVKTLLEKLDKIEFRVS